MTRNSKGKIVDQCEETYEADGHHVHCVMEKGHDERHSDARGDWKSDDAPGSATAA